MDIQHLRAFIRFSEAGHLSQTANEFRVPKGTLWKYINRVEDELGTTLYEHKKKRVILTEEGQDFLETARAIVERIDECSARLHNNEYNDDGQSQLRVGVFGLMTPYGITDQLIAFKQQQPHKLNIRVLQEDTKTLEDMMDRGELELAYTRSWNEPDNRFERLLVCTDEAYIVLSQDHPLAAKEILTWSELRQERFLLMSEGGISYRECIRCCEEAGFRPRIGGTFTSADTVFSMVGKGEGISFLLSKPGKRYGYISKVVLKKVTPSCVLRVWLVHPKKYELSGNARKLWDYVMATEKKEYGK